MQYNLVDPRDLRECLQARLHQVYQPFMTIAYLCDPLARTERKVNVEDFRMRELLNWLEGFFGNRASAVLRRIRPTMLPTTPFDDKPRWELATGQFLDASKWWDDSDGSYDLKRVAKYALAINPTIGASERDWSTHSFIPTKLRNRLTWDRVEKLVYIHHNILADSDREG
jgi:hypothetical protein